MNCVPGPAAPALSVPSAVEQDGEAARDAALGEDNAEANRGRGTVVDEARAPDQGLGNLLARDLFGAMGLGEPGGRLVGINQGALVKHVEEVGTLQETRHVLLLRPGVVALHK